jgi:hypothetical protein
VKLDNSSVQYHYEPTLTDATDKAAAGYHVQTNGDVFGIEPAELVKLLKEKRDDYMIIDLRNNSVDGKPSNRIHQ